MKVRCWGVRGSIPAPCSTPQIEQKILNALLGAPTIGPGDRAAAEKYVRSLPLNGRGTWGSNTPCIEVRTQAGDLLILDAGSGLRLLGMALMQEAFGRGQGRAAILLSHTHWDHIQGWPFFTPFYVAGNHFEVYGCHEDLEERLRLQQDPRFFPVSLDDLPATIHFERLQGPLQICDGHIALAWMEGDHPARSFVFKVQADGKTFIYASDVEYKEPQGPYYERCVEFYRNADLLLFDAQYIHQEVLEKKYNWGHSSILTGIDIAAKAGVRRILFSHYDPFQDDDTVEEIFQDSLRYAQERLPHPERQMILAYEGLELQV
jgi:phosphoribosyl 1,2-cyclic phosphodiesterase